MAQADRVLAFHRIFPLDERRAKRVRFETARPMVLNLYPKAENRIRSSPSKII